MNKPAGSPDVIITTLPDGQRIAFPARPGVLLTEPSGAGHTGVYDLAWAQAQAFIGQPMSPGKVRAGWPRAMNPARLGNLQFPREGIDPADQAASNAANTSVAWVLGALTGLCERGQVPCVRTTEHYGTDYLIQPGTFLDWLGAQGLAPSRFIVAWCRANGVEAEPTPEETVPPPAADRHPATRADLLTPVIKRAIREAGHGATSAQVFAILQHWARRRDPPPPLFGVCDGGIQWKDANDNPKELSQGALRDRMRRLKDK